MSNRAMAICETAFHDAPLVMGAWLTDARGFYRPPGPNRRQGPSQGASFPSGRHRLASAGRCLFSSAHDEAYQRIRVHVRAPHRGSWPLSLIGRHRLAPAGRCPFSPRVVAPGRTRHSDGRGSPIAAPHRPSSGPAVLAPTDRNTGRPHRNDPPRPGARHREGRPGAGGVLP